MTTQHTERTPEEEERHQAALKHQQLEDAEVMEVLNAIKKYAKPVIAGILIIGGVFIAINAVKVQKAKKEAKADTALIKATNSEELQAIIDNYSSTKAAPVALIALARKNFNEGNVDVAETLYTQFTTDYSKHDLLPQAELNVIMCKEAKGQFGDAHTLYNDFIQKNKGSFLVPSAMMGKARCLQALDQTAEAKVVYEDIVINFPNTGWSFSAQAELKALQTK